MQTPAAIAARTISPGLVIGCAVAFALPFILGGIFMIAFALFGGDEPAWFWSMIAFGLVFVGTGASIVAGAISLMRRAAAVMALRAAAPDEPWRWREDWAAGYANELAGKDTVSLFVFSVVWLGISLAFLALARPAMEQGNLAVLFILLFPVIGVGMLALAIYRFLRGRKFGTTVLHLNTNPCVPGRSVNATMRAKIETLPEEGFTVRIAHIHQWKTRSGKSSTTHEKVLWEETKVVPRGAVAPSPESVSIPINFALPQDAPETVDTDQSDRRLWRLEVKAALPGIDFSAQFEVPVFRLP